MRLAVEKLEAHGIREEAEIPTLIAVSDMQFNAAAGTSCPALVAVPPSAVFAADCNYCGAPWGTVHGLIRTMFADYGVWVAGRPLQPPSIVYWNVCGRGRWGCRRRRTRGA